MNTSTFWFIVRRYHLLCTKQKYFVALNGFQTNEINDSRVSIVAVVWFFFDTSRLYRVHNVHRRRRALRKKCSEIIIFLYHTLVFFPYLFRSFRNRRLLTKLSVIALYWLKNRDTKKSLECQKKKKQNEGEEKRKHKHSVCLHVRHEC